MFNLWGHLLKNDHKLAVSLQFRYNHMWYILPTDFSWAFCMILNTCMYLSKGPSMILNTCMYLSKGPSMILNTCMYLSKGPSMILNTCMYLSKGPSMILNTCMYLSKGPSMILNTCMYLSKGPSMLGNSKIRLLILSITVTVSLASRHPSTPARADLYFSRDRVCMTSTLSVSSETRFIGG